MKLYCKVSTAGCRSTKAKDVIMIKQTSNNYHKNFEVDYVAEFYVYDNIVPDDNLWQND